MFFDADINAKSCVFVCCRAGVSVISHRLATANNPRTEDGFDSDREASYIAYFDANNLYGL